MRRTTARTTARVALILTWGPCLVPRAVADPPLTIPILEAPLVEDEAGQGDGQGDVGTEAEPLPPLPPLSVPVAPRPPAENGSAVLAVPGIPLPGGGAVPSRRLTAPGSAIDPDPRLSEPGLGPTLPPTTPGPASGLPALVAPSGPVAVEPTRPGGFPPGPGGHRPPVPGPSGSEPRPLTLEPFTGDDLGRFPPAGAPARAPSVHSEPSREPEGGPRQPPPRPLGNLTPRWPRLFGDRSGPSPPTAPTDAPLRIEPPPSDPAADSALRRRLEHQIRETMGDRLRSADVRVVGRQVHIRARAARFWQRRSVRRALESLPGLDRYHVRVEVE